MLDYVERSHNVKLFAGRNSPRVKLEKRHAVTEPSACDGDALRM